MKIAIFHNYMDNIGGAEMVGLILARELGADLYSTNVSHEKIAKMGFSDIEVRSIGTVPINAPLRQQLALARFRLLDLSRQYDLFFIDGDWAMAGAVRNKPNVWYVHSPIREIWDLYRYTRQHSVRRSARLLFDAWVHFNRFLNRRYTRHVDRIVCNSQNTRARVRKYLGRDAEVVYPPIDTQHFRYDSNGDYWLSVNRLIAHKRVDLQMRAFERLPEERLVIVGSYEKSSHFQKYAKYVASIAPANVTLKHWVPREELVELYAGCKGFITTGCDEDFGITPVEAMASGKPVIAPRQGGYVETVVDGETGMLLDELTPERLSAAVREVGRAPESYRESCIARSREFDTSVFIARIKKIVSALCS